MPELEEELGILVALSPGSPTYAVSNTGEMRMTVYLVTDWLGDPVNQDTTEHDDIRWFDQAEIRGLELAHSSLRGIIDRAF